MESFEDEESDDSLEEEDAQESNGMPMTLLVMRIWTGYVTDPPFFVVAFLKPATKKLLEGGKRKSEESLDKKSKKVKVQLEEDEDDEDDSDFDMDSSSEEGVEEEEEEEEEDDEEDEDDDEEEDAGKCSEIRLSLSSAVPCGWLLILL